MDEVCGSLTLSPGPDLSNAPVVVPQRALVQIPARLGRIVRGPLNLRPLTLARGSISREYASISALEYEVLASCCVDGSRWSSKS